jgi:hypothetical protein
MHKTMHKAKFKQVKKVSDFNSLTLLSMSRLVG